MAQNEKIKIPFREVSCKQVGDGHSSCFAAGTLVKVLGGYKPIEQVRVGDMVLTHMGRYRRVTATTSRTADETLAVRVQGAPEIVCTPNHQFYAMTPYRPGKSAKREPRWIAARWIAAGRLDRRAYVATILGKIKMRVWVPVKGTTPLGVAQVFNLSVEEDQTYTVTEFNVAVHNCSTLGVGAGRGIARHGDR